MWKQIVVLGLWAAAMAGLWGSAWGQEGPPSEKPRKFAFESNAALAGWTITGDVAVDTTKGRDGKGGSLKVGPGGMALLKLRDSDESGKIELWACDDGATPQEGAEVYQTA